MSGSSSNGNWRPDPIQPRIQPNGGDEGCQPDVCNLVEVTNLNSVDPSILATLAAGMQLQVRYEPGPPRRLLAETGNSRIVGSITSQSMAQIILCIQAGRNYAAEIQSIHGGICRVEVHLA
jgi:hypothetical protein